MQTRVTYSESHKIVYCRQCGVIAGKPTKCPGWQTHDFVSTEVPVVCENCGAIPGDATKCPGWQQHDFRPVQ